MQNNIDKKYIDELLNTVYDSYLSIGCKEAAAKLIMLIFQKKVSSIDIIKFKHSVFEKTSQLDRKNPIYHSLEQFYELSLMHLLENKGDMRTREER